MTDCAECRVARATVGVGRGQRNRHLCESCAALSRFKRNKKLRLPRSHPNGHPDCAWYESVFARDNNDEQDARDKARVALHLEICEEHRRQLLCAYDYVLTLPAKAEPTILACPTCGSWLDAGPCPRCPQLQPCTGCGEPILLQQCCDGIGAFDARVDSDDMDVPHACESF